MADKSEEVPEKAVAPPPENDGPEVFEAKKPAAPPEPAEVTETPESTPETPPETKKAKGLKRLFFWRKKEQSVAKSPNQADQEAKPLPDKPTDSLDTNLKVMAEELERKEKQDYWHIRVKKKRVLVGLGLLVLVMWAVAGIQYLGRMGLTWPKIIMIKDVIRAEIVHPTPIPTPLPAVKLRIRYPKTEDATAAASLAAYLAQNSLPVIDTVPDPMSSYSGIMVVSKPSQAVIRADVEKLLEQRYRLSSGAAELTSDSDFDAVILFAP